MGRAEISYKQTSKSAAELKGNKKNVDLDPGFVRMVTCQNWIFFGRHNSCGENLPRRYLLFTSFLHYIMRQRRVPSQHAAGVRECICNLANMVNYTNIACVDAPM